jgi:predicted RNase H-like nuclease (RuvC/YqgF family)
MDISVPKLGLQAYKPLVVQVRNQGPESFPNNASSTTDSKETVSISPEGKALATSTGQALFQASPTAKASASEAANSDENLPPIEKQIKAYKEKVKELKEQLNELKGDNSDAAVEQRKQIQQQIVIYSGLIATLSKKLEEQNNASSAKG